MRTFHDFTQAYRGMLDDVYNRPTYNSSPRGQATKEILGYQFCITDPRNRLPYVEHREFSAQYLAAELVWYLSGSDSTAWIANYSSFWNNISDDGGKTANSAYGSRIFKPHARVASKIDSEWTQWQYVIDELSKDLDSRRAVIHIRSPQDSILANKDVPCTLSLQFFVRDLKLHLVVTMRSSDAILGIAYDVPAFTVFQELMAMQLSQVTGKNIGLGNYIHTSASLHVYEKHFNMVEKILNDSSEDTKLVEPMPRMPKDMRTSEMVTFERLCRASSKAAELEKHVSNLKTYCGNEAWWYDIGMLLASHRAKKIGEEALCDKMLKSTTFRGYHFFNK